MKSKPKPVTLAQVETIHMVQGGEQKISRIIHEGMVKNWVGIGWVTEGKAKPADYFKYPELCQQPQKNGKSSSPKKTPKRCSSTTSTKR